jgi:hypothetical protein
MSGVFFVIGGRSVRAMERPSDLRDQVSRGSALGDDSRKKDKRRPTMMRISTLVTALAVALAASTLATPSFAQRSEEGMSSNRAQALKNCNAEAGKYKQYVWGDFEMNTYRACMAQRGQQE